MKVLFVLCVLVSIFYVCTYGYPTPGKVSGDIVVHDPTFNKVGNTYYTFSTHNRIQTRSSTDRTAWTNRGDALTWWSSSTDLWAPDVTLHGSTYWMYYCKSAFGSQVSSIYLATSTTLAPGSWTDKGTIFSSKAGDPYNAIDPAAVKAGSDWYVSFGSWWQGIYIFKVDGTTGKPTSTPKQIATRPNTAVEGPSIYYKNSYYYMFMSLGNCCPDSKGKIGSPSEKYHIAVCRSKTVDSGYVDKSGKSCLSGGGTNVLEGQSNVWAVGGQAVYYDATDGHDLLVYHWYDSSASYTPKLGVNYLNFTSGWPVAY